MVAAKSPFIFKVPEMPTCKGAPGAPCYSRYPLAQGRLPMTHSSFISRSPTMTQAESLCYHNPSMQHGLVCSVKLHRASGITDPGRYHVQCTVPHAARMGSDRSGAPHGSITDAQQPHLESIHRGKWPPPHCYDVQVKHIAPASAMIERFHVQGTAHWCPTSGAHLHGWPLRKRH